MPSKGEPELLMVDGREVAISNPGKVLFPEAGLYQAGPRAVFLAVAEAALRGAGGRPNVLVRYPDGIHGEFFYQKRAPRRGRTGSKSPPSSSPRPHRGRSRPAQRRLAALDGQPGCLELHPHPVRAEDLDHPDELRIDLDPVPGVQWPQVRDVAQVVHAVLDDLGLVGWPKTSGSRGIHVNVRLDRRWSFTQVRRAALALAREVERRAPGLATSQWWKEERQGVFLDYNQNAKDRTVATPTRCGRSPTRASRPR